MASAFPHGDTLAIVFSFLNTKEKFSVACVSKGFRDTLKIRHAYDGTLKVSNIGDENVERLMRKIPDHSWIKKLIFTNIYSILTSFSIKFSALEYIDLRGCIDVIDDKLACIKNMPLKHLNISGCSKVTDAGLAHCKNMQLQHLTMNYNENITDASLAQLADMPLVYLDVGCCKKITDVGLAHLKRLRLKHLALNGCRQITDNGLLYIKNMPLKHLDLGGCNRVSDEFVRDLLRRSSEPMRVYHK